MYWSSDVCSSDLGELRDVSRDVGRGSRPVVLGALLVARLRPASRVDLPLGLTVTAGALDGAGSRAVRDQVGAAAVGEGDAVGHLGLAPADQWHEVGPPRSAARRVGTECVSTCINRWAP